MKISSSMQSIMFESGQKFILEKNKTPLSESEIELSQRFAMSVNRTLLAMGYSMDTALINTMATYPISDQKEIFQSLNDVIQEHTGANLFKAAQTFYPNFPEEVINKTDFELFINAMIYYTGENLFGINAYEMLKNAKLIEEKKERLPLLELFERKPKIIMQAKEADLHTLMDDRIHGTSLSSSKEEQVWNYKKEYPEMFKNIIENDRKFNSREVLSSLAVQMYKEHSEDNMKILYGGKFIKDANDVLRIAALLSNDYINKMNTKSRRNPILLNDANLSVPTKNMVIKLGINNETTKYRQYFIAKLLDKCPNLYTAIWEKEDKWKKAMPYIGVGAKSKASNRVIKAFDNLHNKKKVNERGEVIVTTGKELNNLINTISCDKNRNNIIESIECMINNSPKYVVQNIGQIMNACPDEKTAALVVDTIAKDQTISRKVDPIDLFKAGNYIKDQHNWDVHVYTTHNGKYYSNNIENPEKKEPIKFSDKLADTLYRFAKKGMENTTKFERVYIDPALKNNKMPTRGERNASGGATYTYGTEIPSDKNHNLLLMGIWWKNPENRTGCDIDLSATFLSKDHGIMDTLYFGKLKNEYSVHSGDFTDGDPLRDGKGAEEVIVIDKEKAKAAGVKYISFYVSGYSVDFNKADNVRCIMMEKEGNINSNTLSGNNNRQEHVSFCGETVIDSQIDNAIRLNAPAQQETPCIFNLEEDKYIWLDATHDIKNGFVTINNKESVVTGNLEIYKAQNNAIPDMYQVFEAYAEANGIITDNIQEADLVFLSKPADAAELGLKEETKIITAYDLDEITKIGSLQPIIEKEMEKTNQRSDVNVSLEEKLKDAHDSLSDKAPLYNNEKILREFHSYNDELVRE